MAKSEFFVTIMVMLSVLPSCNFEEAAPEAQLFSEMFVVQERVRLATENDDPLGAASDIAVWGEVIAVSDRLGTNVKVFSRDGRLLSTLGRLGDGPGEFRYPTSLAVVDEGRLGVLDLRQSQINFFDEDGDFAYAFEFPGVYTGEMVAFDRGTSLLVSTRVAGREVQDSVAPHFVHIFDLDGTIGGSFGRWPQARDRAETPFMGIVLAATRDDDIVWGTVGRHVLFFQDLAGNEGAPTDTVSIPGLRNPDWTKAPEREPDLWNWMTSHELLMGVFEGPDVVIARFRGGDPNKGEEWYRYAIVSQDTKELIAITERTDAYLQTWDAGEALGIEIEADGHSYLTRFQLGMADRSW